MSIKKKIVKLIVFIFCLLFFSIGYFLWQEIHSPKIYGSNVEKVFIVERGQTTKEIAKNLERENLIKNDILFIFYLLSRNKFGTLQAGEYLLSPAMTIPEIIQRITLGDVIIERITIIEGWSVKDIAEYLEYREFFSAEAFLKIVGLPQVIPSKGEKFYPYKIFSNEFNFLKNKPEILGLQGFLFPDTYFFNANQKVSPEIVIRRMLQRFNEKITPELKKEIKYQDKTIFEIITMASILEKEISAPLDMTKREERIFQDKRLAADILWRRLELNMPLQVDATIVYILKMMNDNDLGNIRIAENLDIDSPYNTYLHRGLPLGPISNPGIRSIKAAIYPKANNYFFYLSTPEGKTIFSKTYQEHKYAIKKYLK